MDILLTWEEYLEACTRIGVQQETAEESWNQYQKDLAELEETLAQQKPKKSLPVIK